MNKKPLIAIILILLIILSLSACNQRIVRPTAAVYNIQGAVVINDDNDSIAVSLALKKNDTLTNSVILMIDGDTLKYSGGLYRKSYATANALASGDYQIKLNDNDNIDSIPLALPSGLSISSIALPDSRINPRGAAVHIEWTAAAGSNGYAIGVIKKDSAYSAAGFFQFVTTGGNLISIPPDAFRKSDALDTGWYRVFVYAYSGSPAEYLNLPTNFPLGLTDNITKTNISGSIGAIVVSKPDSIHVTLE